MKKNKKGPLGLGLNTPTAPPIGCLRVLILSSLGKKHTRPAFEINFHGSVESPPPRENVAMGQSPRPLSPATTPICCIAYASQQKFPPTTSVLFFFCKSLRSTQHIASLKFLRN